MDFINSNQSSLDIIFGPMFSGKTTELIRRLTIFVEADLKVLYVNSTLDSRDDVFSTHNKNITSTLSKNIYTIKTHSLTEILDKCTNYDVIGIDESQFFNDLKKGCIELVEKMAKKVIVAGLNGDYRRQSFGQIIDLIPFSDNITKLYPFCKPCRETNTLQCALFTKRIIQSSDESVIKIGSEDVYLPVCRKCYNDE